jgi:hypothetical protein
VADLLPAEIKPGLPASYSLLAPVDLLLFAKYLFVAAMAAIAAAGGLKDGHWDLFSPEF